MFEASNVFAPRLLPISMRCGQTVLLALLLLLVAIIPAKAANLVTDADWQISSHACPGYNTNALFRDDDGTLWVGCGSNAAGYGLYLSTDGGTTWALAIVNPSYALNTFRVNSISRGEGGELAIAGFNASNRDMVLALDTSSAPFAVSKILVGSGTVARQFQVGTYRERRQPDGAISRIATSLNGSATVIDNAGHGSSAADWDSYYPASEILDLTVFDNRFWASGSSIDEPPQLFLPPEDRLLTTPMTVAQPELSWAWEGELWGVAVNEDRLVAVGIDQDNNIGSILISGSDPRDMSNYRELSVSQIIGAPTAMTWARGVCMRGNRVVVVGERQPLSTHTGLVLLSDDGGQTFANVAPSSVKASVYRCTIGPGGEVVVAGADGFIGILSGDRIFASGFESP